MNYSTNLAVNQVECNSDGLFNHIITKLPSLTLGFKSKQTFDIRLSLPSHIVLERMRWIEYNQSWVNMLIFDIDRSMSLQEGINLCLDLEFEPSWICKTDRGVHIAYTLTDKVNYEWKKAIKLARHIKEKITTLLKADVQGSHKLKGIWRNPLLHEHYYSGLTYSLNDFKYLLNNKDSMQRKFKKHIVRQKANNGILEFKKGTRNDYIWRTAMIQTKDKNMSYDDTFNLVHDLNMFESNSKSVEPLPNSEIQTISKSVFKYNEKDMNYIGGVDNKKDIRGSMGFEPIAKDGYVSKETHKQIVKERQSKSAKRTNKIGDMMTRVERAKANSRKREKESREKIQNAITGLMADSMFKKKNGTWNIVKIAEYVGMSRNTVSKHLKELI